MASFTKHLSLSFPAINILWFVSSRKSSHTRTNSSSSFFQNHILSHYGHHSFFPYFFLQTISLLRVPIHSSCRNHQHHHHSSCSLFFSTSLVYLSFFPVFLHLSLNNINNEEHQSPSKSHYCWIILHTIFMPACTHQHISSSPPFS